MGVWKGRKSIPVGRHLAHNDSPPIHIACSIREDEQVEKWEVGRKGGWGWGEGGGKRRGWAGGGWEGRGVGGGANSKHWFTASFLQPLPI